MSNPLHFPSVNLPQTGYKTQDERDEMSNEYDEDETTTVLGHTLGKSMPTIEAE